jgi:large subunit ribosomal protein L20
MARVKGSVATRASRKKILNRAEGYFGSKHLLFKTAKEQVLHSLRYAYVSRREAKRDFRKLWIKRINAACHENGISYSKFMDGLKKSGIAINRKMLSEMAISDAAAFKSLVETARKASNKPEPKAK